MNLSMRQGLKMLICLLIIGILIMFLIVSNRHPDIIRDIDDPSSPLLELVKCEEGSHLPEYWKIETVFISQVSDDNDGPYISCYQIGEGIYKGVHKIFSIRKILIFPTDKRLSYEDVVDTVLVGQFFPAFIKIGEYTESYCTKNEKEFSCTVGVQYEDAIFFVLLVSNDMLDNSQIEYIVNFELIGFDKLFNSK